MKKIYILICCLLSAIAANAQDILVKMDTSEEKVKVLEIGSSDIRYRKFENPDGPVYTIPRSEVFIIRFENGTKEVITEITSSAPTEISTKNETIISPAYSHVEEARQMVKQDVHKKKLYILPQPYIGWTIGTSDNISLVGLDTGIEVFCEYFPDLKNDSGYSAGLGYNYKYYDLENYLISVKNIDIHAGYAFRSDDNKFSLRASLFLDIPLRSNILYDDAKIKTDAANALFGFDFDFGWRFKWFILGGSCGLGLNNQFDLDGIKNHVAFMRFFIGTIF